MLSIIKLKLGRCAFVWQCLLVWQQGLCSSPISYIIIFWGVQNIETVGFNYEPALERRGSVEVRLTFEVVLQETQDGTFPLLTNYLSAQNLFQKSSGTESPPL